MGCVHRYLVVRTVTVLDPQVVVLKVDVQVRKDQLILDETPDDAGHLVPVQLDDRGIYLDFHHHILIGVEKP